MIQGCCYSIFLGGYLGGDLKSPERENYLYFY